MKYIGFIGLGKMGSKIAERIIDSGHSVFAFDSNEMNLNRAIKRGAYGCKSITEIAEKLPRNRVIMLCVPAGKIIDRIIEQLHSHLSAGDTLIDLGNSFYKDTQRRAKKLGKKGVDLIDVGVSGGVEGARDGACLMIGGNISKVSRLKNIFKAMSRNGAYRYLGKSGAGHLVKGLHNLIEYGYLQSLAEGLESLDKISKNEGMPMSLGEICELWSKGSIIESKIVLDANKALKRDRFLKKVNGVVYGQTLDEMKKLIRIAKKSGVRIYSCGAAVKARIESQRKPSCSGQIINAIRNVFGGHTA